MNSIVERLQDFMVQEARSCSMKKFRFMFYG